MNPELVEKLELSLPPGWHSQLPESVLTTDAEKMRFVLQLGMWNISRHAGGPFSAAVFCRSTHQLVSIGVNCVVPRSCSLAHAEAVALALAQQQLQTHDLTRAGSGDYELVASGQPCVQCFGMVWWSGVTRLVIGARSADIEELTGFHEGPLPDRWPELLADRPPLPAVTVVQDVCRDDARALLQSYTDSGGEIYSPGISQRPPETNAD